MSSITIVEREMTDAEFAWKCSRYEEHLIEQGYQPQTHEQYGVVALAGDTFVGCASGRVYQEGGVPTGWFYLSDLFVEKAYRKRGLGATLLRHLEDRMARLGVEKVWTDTAGYEAPGFYKKQGYQVFCERENRYFTGHSEILLNKRVEPRLDSYCVEYISDVRVEERLMTTTEYARMNAGFDEHTAEHGNPVEQTTRHGFVALAGDELIGCISGLAGRNWFFITDLFLQKSYRGHWIGATLLRRMEERAAELGSQTVWAWTVGDEAGWFSERHGYSLGCRQDNWTHAGHSRAGLRKSLLP